MWQRLRLWLDSLWRVDSAVAGILKPDGGLRIVVSNEWHLRHHVAPGERLFVVPGLKVREPVPWGAAQVNVIRAAQRHVVRTLAPVNPCGECRQCCKTLYIKDDSLTKASHQWCRNVDPELGCSVYWKRPKPCQAFACLWLKSQRTATPMAAELRPDHSRVVLTHDTAAVIGETPDPDLIELHVDRETPDALDRPALAAFLAGKKTKRITHYYGETA